MEQLVSVGIAFAAIPRGYPAPNVARKAGPRLHPRWPEWTKGVAGRDKGRGRWPDWTRKCASCDRRRACVLAMVESASGGHAMSKIEHPVRPNRIRPFTILRCFLAVVRDPENTEAGARMVLCLAGDEAKANFDRFRAHPVGQRILAGAPTAYELLTDHAALRAMPEGSLGREFLAFVEREGISTQGLADATRHVEDEVMKPNAEVRRYFDHMRSTHDLWHVLTGYSRDILGELLLLSFTYGQTRNRPFGWIVRFAKIGIERKLPGANARELIEEADARAQRAEWLPTADWETLLPLPLDEVRERLGLGEPPRYTRWFRPKEGGIRLVPETDPRAA